MTIIKLQKAAMFALDARIVLFIFTALSLVIASSIYHYFIEAEYGKVFSDARTIAYGVTTYMKDLKVSIADTVDPAENSDSKELYMFYNLLNDTHVWGIKASRWAGPYINLKSISLHDSILGSSYRLTRLSDSLSSTCADSQFNPCFIFLKFTKVSEELCDGIEKFASGANLTSLQRQGTVGLCELYIKLTPDF